jgi:hypothetical protein
VLLRRELAKWETAINDGKLFRQDLREVYIWQYTACKMILKAFYDEPGTPMDILERMINTWDVCSTLDNRTSLMFSTMKDYALNLYDILIIR